MAKDNIETKKVKRSKATGKPIKITGIIQVGPKDQEPFKYSHTIIKKVSILLLIILCTVLDSEAQSYLGSITKQVNLREGPGTAYNTIVTLKAGSQVFIVSLEAENDFYNVVDIQTNKEGYVHKSFIKVGQRVKENEPGIFAPSGETTSYNPQVEIFNNTKLKLTLKLNDKNYSFDPNEKRTITLSPGAVSYRASAPGVIPNIGTEIVKSNEGYTWQFYIVTRYR